MSSQSGRIGSVGLVCAILVSAGGGAALADEIYVPGDYSTIQQAIHAATDGDTILLGPPTTFSGPGNVNLDFGGKALTVRPAPGLGRVTIACGGSTGFNFHSGEDTRARIQGLKITYAATGAIVCNGASPSIVDCEIDSNSGGAAGIGGGLTCRAGASPVLRGCLFQQNGAYGSGQAAGNGGAVLCQSELAEAACAPAFSDCRFVANFAQNTGGAVFCRHARPLFTHCYFASNYSEGLYTAGLVGQVFSQAISNRRQPRPWSIVYFRRTMPRHRTRAVPSAAMAMCA